MSDFLTIAVDFDGTLCEYAFPEIGEQSKEQKKLMEILISMREEGHKIILWTNRGDNDKYPVLSQAVQWCKEKGLEFDAVNSNIPGQKKISGYSPKVMADYYIDDKVLEFTDLESRKNVLLKLLKIKEQNA